MKVNTKAQSAKSKHLAWPKKSAIAMAVITSFHAHAEDNVVSDTQTNRQYPTEEIYVYGQFQQSLIDRIPVTPKELPFTLNVIDQDFLEQRNFTRPIEALTTLPNVGFVEDRLGTGTPRFFIRGFEAPVLVDNRVQNGFRGAGARDNSFIERYEVLKGPASIALGPVESGGVINTVTKTPEVDKFTDIELRTDQFGSIGAEFDTNFGNNSGSDNAMIRISGAYRDFSFDADETERDTFAIRPVMTMDLGESTSVKASVAYTRTNVNPNKGFPLTEDNKIPSQITTSTFTGFANGEGTTEDTYIEAELQHEFLDGLKLTVRGSHQNTDFDYQNTSGVYNYGYGNYSYSYRGETEENSTFFDVQLAYQTELWGEQQDFVVGASYNEADFERDFSSFPAIGPFSFESLSNPRLGQDTFTDLSPFSLFDNQVYAMFAETAVRPSEKLTIIAGIRHDDVDQVSTRFRRGAAFDNELVGEETTFRIGATYKLTQDTNVFASFAEAFTPQSGIRRDNSTVGPELTDGFEIGSKGTYFDGILNLETTLFHTVRQDVAVSDPTNVVDEFFTVNVGELEAKGIEITADFNPSDELSIALSYGYTDTKIVEAGDDEVQAAVFPENTGSAFIAYKINPKLTIGGGFRYVDERGLEGAFDSYTVADLNSSYQLNDKMKISFDVLNVTDELYVESASAFAGPTGGAVLGAPRTAVLTLRSRF